MPDDIKIRVSAEGVELTQEALNRLAQAEKGHEAGVFSIKRIFGDAIATLKAFVLTALSIEGVSRVIEQVIQRFESLRRAIEEVARESLEAQRGVVGLASQLGDTSPAGQKRAATITGELAKAGGIGWGTAASLAMAADVALPGGLMKGRNMETAKAFAGFVGSIGADASQASGFLEFLQSAGAVGSPEALLAAAGKAMAAAGAAKGSKAEFVGQLQRGGIPLLAQGVPLEDVLRIAVQARQTAASGELAGETMRSVGRVAGGAVQDADRALLIQSMRDVGVDFDRATPAQRIEGLQRMFAGAKTEQQRRVLQQITGESYMRLQAMFSPEAIAQTAGAAGAIRNAGAEGVMRDIAGFRESDVAKQAAMEADRAVRRVRIGKVSAQRLTDEAAERFKERRQDRRDSRFKTETAEKGEIELKLLEEELNQRIKEAEGMPGSAEAVRELRKLRDETRNSWGGLIDPFDKVHRDVVERTDRANAILEGLNKGGGGVNINVTNVMGNQNFLPDARVQPQRFEGMSD